MTNNKAELDAIYSEGQRQFGDKQFENAYNTFMSLVERITRGAHSDTTSRILPGIYCRAESAAYAMSREPNIADARAWLERALVAGEAAVNSMEPLIRSGEVNDLEARGHMLAQLHTLSQQNMALGNHEKCIEIASRSMKFQEDFKDEGVVSMLYLSACGNKVLALLQLKRLDEALSAVNSALYSHDPEDMNDRDGLKCYAKLCEIKGTILGARNAKKLN